MESVWSGTPAEESRSRGAEWAVRAIALLALVYMTEYIVWRWTSTLNPAALWISVPLALAETYIVLRAYLIVLQIWSLPRPEWREPRRDLTVDVFITTFNEPLEILRKTALAAKTISYPHRTYLLDDGRRREVRHLARELGIEYIRRHTNEKAKAGNLNHALGQTSGEFILQLDADHVPLPNILDRLLGYFVSPDIAYVQSPQEFYNTDSFMHSVKRRARRIWDEQRFFFGVMQPGRARLNAAIFCGSCGAIRREALKETGGFAGETITEDMETSLILHGKGWKSVYTPEALAYGLAPDTFLQFQVQRLRWAQGTMQLFRRYNPITYPGLTLAQRLCYFDSFFYYFEGVVSLILFVTPAVFLLTGALPLATTNGEFLRHFIPYIVLSIGMFELLARGTGMFWLLARYTVARYWIYIRAIGGFFARGRLKFEVTPKRAGHVPLRVYAPQVALALGLTISLALGVAGRLAGIIPGPGLSSLAFVLSSTWGLWTAWMALGLVRMARAERANRGEFRFPETIPAHFLIVGPAAEAPVVRLALTEDLSRGGVAMRTIQPLPLGTQVRLQLPLATSEVEVTGEVVHARMIRSHGSVQQLHGIRFLEVPPAVGDAIEMHCAQHSVASRNLLFRHEHDLVSRFSRWIYDTRRGRRAAVALPAEVRVEAAPDSPSGPYIGVLDDISARGARLLLQEPLAPGTTIDVAVPGTPIAFTGRVIFSRALPTSLAVRFVVGIMQEGAARSTVVVPQSVEKEQLGGVMRERVGLGSWGGSWAPVVQAARTVANRFRVAPVVALVLAGAALAARPAAAQTANGWGVTFYNGDEIATDNLQLVLLGASASSRAPGVTPVLSAQGYWLHYGKSPGDVTQWAFTPSAGLKLNFQGGALQGRVGYTFVNKDVGGAGAFAPGGGSNGVTTTVQADYWDSGKGMGQAIVNYNWGAETLWSRGRLGTRIAQTASGSVGILGEAAYLRAKSSTTAPDYSVWQVGPGISYTSNSGFGATLSGGAKLPNQGKKSGYVHLDMYLSR